MSRSSLTNVVITADGNNYSVGRSKKIRCITPHHVAGVISVENLGGIFRNPTRGGSSNYGIGNDGRIGCFVDEENTPWTNSNWDSNCESVTIEVSNSEAGGNWPVGDAAINSLIKLMADIAIRNGLGTLELGRNVTLHKMFTQTSCPGPYMESKMPYIISEANKIINPAPVPTPTPQPSGNLQDYMIVSGDTLSRIAVKFNTTVDYLMSINPQISNKDLIYAGQVMKVPTVVVVVDTLLLVKRTIRGDFGNMPERKAKIEALGGNYNEVQRQIDLNYANGTISWNNIRLY